MQHGHDCQNLPPEEERSDGDEQDDDERNLARRDAVADRGDLHGAPSNAELTGDRIERTRRRASVCCLCSLHRRGVLPRPGARTAAAAAAATAALRDDPRVVVGHDLAVYDVHHEHTGIHSVPRRITLESIVAAVTLRSAATGSGNQQQNNNS